VVADVANLPFKDGVFEGVVSLHTLHHIPAGEQVKAYGEVYRVMALNSSAVVVNGWTASRIMNRLNGLVLLMERLLKREKGRPSQASAPLEDPDSSNTATPVGRPAGTFVHKIDAAWLRQSVGARMDLEIRCWRSVSVRFLRAVIHPRLGGRLWLGLLFWLEDRFPGFLGENGQYPLVIIRKPG
jgi:hypothetical protein